MARFTVVLDDAYIALRVASNWAHFGAPEYNPGVHEWVPTSFLWVGLVAAASKLVPGGDCVWIARVLGGLCGVATILLLALGLPRWRAAAAAAALLCAGSAIWAAWPLSGMDAALFTLLVAAAAMALLRTLEVRTRGSTVLTGLLFGLLSVARPDGVVLAVAAAAIASWLLRDLKWLSRFGLGYAVTVVPAVGYMLVEFKTLVPVSYYAKVHGLANVQNGLHYVLEAARTYHLAPAIPVIAVALWSRGSRRPAAVALALLVTWIAWVIADGGDFLPYHRFLAPAWPLFALLCGLGLERCVAWLRGWRPGNALLWPAAAALLLLGACVAWTTPSLEGSDRVRYEANAIDEQMREAIGRYFAGKLQPSDWIAVKPAGIIPYYSGAPAVDLFCLTDLKAARGGQWVPAAWVGHQRMNAARIHEVGPRVVILDARLYRREHLPPPGMTDPNHGGGWLSDARASRYSPVQVEVVPDYWLNFFYRR